MKRRAGILFSIVIADGTIFGMALGIVHANMPGAASEVRQAVQVDGAAGVAPGRPSGAVQADGAAGVAPGRSSGAIQADGGADFPVGQGEQKEVALTFDDGPHGEYTPMLLEGLRSRGVKATFFLMGENIPGNEDVVRQMQQDGHLIGNHSFRHVQLTKAGADAVCSDVEKTEELISQITGARPEYLRPPYGDWNENLECRLDLTPVFWTVDSLDWKLKNTAKIVDRVEKRVGNGDIILMHDIFPTSVEAALELVDLLQQQGYRFVTAEELLID